VRLSARLAAKTAIPNRIQKETRAVCTFVFIVALMIFKYIIPRSASKKEFYHCKNKV